MRIRTRSKLLLGGLAAAVLLGTVVSTASANRLSVSELRFQIAWAALVFATEPSNITCPATLSGSFHSRTIAKVSRILVGHVTEASLGTCEFDGRATVLRETLPWHITYDHFVGSLPNITHIILHLVGASFRAEDGIPCLARTDFAEPAVATAVRNTATGQITTLNANAEEEIDIDDPGFLCAAAGDVSLSGNGRVTTQSGALLFVNLI